MCVAHAAPVTRPDTTPSKRVLAQVAGDPAHNNTSRVETTSLLHNMVGLCGAIRSRSDVVVEKLPEVTLLLACRRQLPPSPYPKGLQIGSRMRRFSVETGRADRSQEPSALHGTESSHTPQREPLRDTNVQHASPIRATSSVIVLKTPFFNHGDDLTQQRGASEFEARHLALHLLLLFCRILLGAALYNAETYHCGGNNYSYQ